MSEQTKDTNTAKKPEGRYSKNDIFYKAIEALHDNMYQTTFKSPEEVPDYCQDKDTACSAGCAACGFKCGRSFSRSEYDGLPGGDDPYGDRNSVNALEPPEPETTFPFVQMIAVVIACIVGCYFANGFILNLLGH
ncbi:MAG: hypothetical protein Q4E57_10530 [Eubacteriales bacterium]|nr:hypothetical protein [Eubacteriales bacterium]